MHLKRCSALHRREMQIKTTVSYTISYLSDWQKSKAWQYTQALFHTQLMRMQNGPPLWKGNLAILIVITSASALWCGNSTSGNLSYSNTCHVQNDMCTRLCTTALFLTINWWRQSKWLPSAGAWWHRSQFSCTGAAQSGAAHRQSQHQLGDRWCRSTPGLWDQKLRGRPQTSCLMTSPGDSDAYTKFRQHQHKQWGYF